MAGILVCGGGVVGLSAAMMLAADGHDVTVLEGDAGEPPVPREAWIGWPRAGVAQFRQPHSLFARARQILDDELPGTTRWLLDAGCVRVSYLHPLPPALAGTGPRPGDERFRMVTGRRPVLEAVLAAAAAGTPGLDVRRGVRVAELLTGPAAVPGVPHVSGVRTTAGDTLRADLVVDATGRRAGSDRWLPAAGARPADVRTEDRGFVYYSRFFTGPVQPQRRGRALTPLGSVSLLTLHGDNDTWSVTLFGLSGDAPLKALRDPRLFDRVLAACPQHAHWADGTPITGVLPMAGTLDRYRRFVVDGLPVVTGFAAVGDAWACTNPSAGRGMTVGLIHAQQLRHTVRAHLDPPARFAAEWDRVTEEVVAPYHWDQVTADRTRVAEMSAAVLGAEPPAPHPVTSRFLAAAGQDPDLFRALLETVLCMALPQEVLARPAVADRLEGLGELPAPPPASGPDRAALLDLLAG